MGAALIFNAIAYQPYSSYWLVIWFACC